ncbi:hypothetical protein [Deinococcus irradiatisoli]|nr:hypothetical protein [Deinococcus irradiatisoli]
MRRPGVLIGLLLVILVLCGGLVYLDQTGGFGGGSSASTSSDPYGGLK